MCKCVDVIILAVNQFLELMNILKIVAEMKRDRERKIVRERTQITDSSARGLERD